MVASASLHVGSSPYPAATNGIGGGTGATNGIGAAASSRLPYRSSLSKKLPQSTAMHRRVYSSANTTLPRLRRSPSATSAGGASVSSATPRHGRKPTLTRMMTSPAPSLAHTHEEPKKDDSVEQMLHLQVHFLCCSLWWLDI